MATFPVTTGDVLTAATYNSLPTFTIGSAQTADYTAVSADQYQALQLMNKATAIAFKLPTNASVAFPVGTAITVLNDRSHRTSPETPCSAPCRSCPIRFPRGWTTSVRP